jgi:hypothetical protein
VAVNLKQASLKLTSAKGQQQQRAPLLLFQAVFRIRMFFGLLDPDPDPLVRGMDPDPSFIKQK